MGGRGGDMNPNVVASRVIQRHSAAEGERLRIEKNTARGRQHSLRKSGSFAESLKQVRRRGQSLVASMIGGKGGHHVRAENAVTVSQEFHARTEQVGRFY